MRAFWYGARTSDHASECGEEQGKRFLGSKARGGNNHRTRGGDERATPVLIGAAGGIRDPHYPRGVSEPRPDTGIRVVEAPRAPAGSGDSTRRWALGFPDGEDRFPGVTRLEAQAALPALIALGRIVTIRREAAGRCEIIDPVRAPGSV